MEGNLIVDSVEKFELMFKNVQKAQAEFSKFSQEEVDRRDNLVNKVAYYR